MDSSSTAPCPHCQVAISTEATICPQCRSGVLVDLRLVDAITDGRIRYRVGRALVTLGEGVPPFSELQKQAAVRGGIVLPAVSRALAHRAQALFEAERVAVRVVNSVGPAPSESSPAGMGLKIGVAAAVLVALGIGAVLSFRGGPPAGAGNSAAGVPAPEAAARGSEKADGPALSPTKVAELGMAATVALSCSNRLGTGFFVEKGVLITNAHVLCPDSPTLKVRFSDGREVQGTVENSDEAVDLAVVRAPGLLGAPLSLGDAGALKVGQPLTMVGSPKGLDFTVHHGGVSNLDRREMGVAYIQVDAAVNPGNSGGPLIDERGRVVGVITAKQSDAEGIGLAVPINYLHSGSSPLLPDLAGPRSAVFARMAQKAESESQQMAADIATTELLPAFAAAEAGGGAIRVAVLLPASSEPAPRSFTFHLSGSTGGHVCSVEGAVSRWVKVVRQDGSSPLGARADGWLKRQNLSIEYFVGYALTRLDQCEGLRVPFKMELLGADPDLNEMTFS